VSEPEGPFPSLAGDLLVAAPALVDPNFRRAVVLLIEHEPEGAVGVILNRPIDHEAREAVPALEPILPASERLHRGGPVETEAAIALAEYRDLAVGPGAIVGPIGVLAAPLDGESLVDEVARARVYLGYSGWGPGQLEAELAEEAWFVTAAEPGDVFGEDADGLWAAVLGRMGGPYAVVATMPDDPSLN
jgi:putative transcriptional regulator